MFEEKWTPGPWHIGDVDSQIDGFVYQDVHAGEYGNGTYKSIAHVQAAFDGEHAEEMIGEDFANARLIAAAPDGLAVAEELCAILDSFVDAEGTFDDDPNGLVNDIYKSGVHEKLTAFIAKARGEAA